MHGRQRVDGMSGENTHVECCVRRHTGQATLLALRDTNRDRPARDRARPQRLPAPGLTRPFPWQEAGDLKTLASMQARPVTPHVAEKPLAPGLASRGGGRGRVWGTGAHSTGTARVCRVWKRPTRHELQLQARRSRPPRVRSHLHTSCCTDHREGSGGGRGSEIFLPLLPPCSD